MYIYLTFLSRLGQIFLPSKSLKGDHTDVCRCAKWANAFRGLYIFLGALLGWQHETLLSSFPQKNGNLKDFFFFYFSEWGGSRSNYQSKTAPKRISFGATILKGGRFKLMPTTTTGSFNIWFGFLIFLQPPEGKKGQTERVPSIQHIGEVQTYATTKGLGPPPKKRKEKRGQQRVGYRFLWCWNPPKDISLKRNQRWGAKEGKTKNLGILLSLMEKEAECANHPSHISIANPLGLRIFFLPLVSSAGLVCRKKRHSEKETCMKGGFLLFFPLSCRYGPSRRRRRYR